MTILLHSEVTGEPSKPPLVIVHGLFGSISNWRSIAKSLAGDFYIHCVDLRNHGQSPWADTMSYLDMAADLNRYIRDNQLQQPNLLGHSMGGKTCMAMLQQFVPGVSSVFIVDIAPVQYGHNHDHLIESLISLDLASIRSRSEADIALSLSIPSLPIRQFLLQNLQRTATGFSWRVNLAAIAEAKQEIFGYPNGTQCDTPIIFIKGENSDYIVADYYNEIFRNFPKAKFRIINNAGHWLHAEQPADLIHLIRQ